MLALLLIFSGPYPDALWRSVRGSNAAESQFETAVSRRRLTAVEFDDAGRCRYIRLTLLF